MTHSHIKSLATSVSKRLGKTTRGAAAAEYAIIIASVAVTLILSVTLFGAQLSTLFGSLAAKIPGASAPLPIATPCVEGSNANGFWNNRYWTYSVDYTDPVMGDSAVIGSMWVDGDSPDGSWTMSGLGHYYPDHADVYPFENRGALLSTWAHGGYLIGFPDVTPPVGDNGTTLYNVTDYYYENGVGFVFTDFQFGTPESIIAAHPSEWHGNLWYPDYVQYTSAYALEQGTAGTPYDVRSAATADAPVFYGGRGAFKATPPVTELPGCPAGSNDSWNTKNNGVTCIDTTNSNGWWNNQYWLKSVYYVAPDGWSTQYGSLQVTPSGEQWTSWEWNPDTGQAYTQAEADAAVAAGTAIVQVSWSASITLDTNNPGVLYATPPAEGLASGNVGCPTNPADGGGELG